jgi:hypothetical protein
MALYGITSDQLERWARYNCRPYSSLVRTALRTGVPSTTTGELVRPDFATDSANSAPLVELTTAYTGAL